MEAIHKAVELAEKLQHVFVATADANGLPHVAAASELRLESDGRVAAAAWFCPATVSNLQYNRRVALVVWDATEDTGYQLVGKVERVEDLAFLDGHAAGEDERYPSPQVERQLIIRADTVLAFSRAPHSDVEE